MLRQFVSFQIRNRRAIRRNIWWTGSCELLEQRQLMTGDVDLVADTGSLDGLGSTRSDERLAVAYLAPEAESSGFAQFSSFSEFKQHWIEMAVRQYQYLFGQNRCYQGCWWYRNESDIFRPGLLRTLSDFDGLSADAVFASDTNRQIESVDEGDIVETDGQFIYMIRQQSLVIIDARNPAALGVVSRTELTDTPVAMYLHNGRLTVLSSRDPWHWDSLTWPVASGMEQSTTTATVWDVSNASSPQMVQQLKFDGRLVDSRAVDGRVILVLTNDGPQLPAPRLLPVDTMCIPAGSPEFGDLIYPDNTWWTESVYETEQQYRERLESLPDDVFLPHYSTLDAQSNVLTTEAINAAEEIYRPWGTDVNSSVSIVSLDMTSNQAGPQHTMTIAGMRAEGVYMTDRSLYVYQPSTSSGDSDPLIVWDQSATDIVKIDLLADGLTLAAKGTVQGRILNQFSLDEHNGFLRVATTSGWAWSESTNSVYVLQQQGNELQIVGSIRGLAAGEQIYSVRFLGERGYVVTFRQVDPLFAIDLSDPLNPTVAGELKVPGFSNYLHPVGEHYLIGIGRNADEATGLFGELQVSLFDVSDINHPVRVAQYLFDGGHGTSTDATFDHHAVSYFADHQILAIPIHNDPLVDWWMEDVAADPTSSVQFLRIDVNKGIESLGLVSHTDRVQRTLQIGASVITMSSEHIKASKIADPTERLSELSYWESPLIAFEPPAPAETQPVETQPVESAPAGGTINNDVDVTRAVPLTPTLLNYDIDQDKTVSQFDAALVIDALHQREASRPWTTDGDADHRHDVNGDGFVSPIDALLIINAVTRQRAQL